MKAPRLNRRLSLESLEELPDGMGGFASHWQPLGQIWAQLRASSGRDGTGEERLLGVVGYKIITRAMPLRPKPGQRLVEGSRIFTIKAVSESDPEGFYLTLWCHEEVAA